MRHDRLFCEIIPLYDAAPMLTLSERDTAMLEGDMGEGLALAMRIVAATARVRWTPPR